MACWVPFRDIQELVRPSLSLLSSLSVRIQVAVAWWRSLYGVLSRYVLHSGGILQSATDSIALQFLELLHVIFVNFLLRFWDLSQGFRFVH